MYIGNIERTFYREHSSQNSNRYFFFSILKMSWQFDKKYSSDYRRMTFLKVELLFAFCQQRMFFDQRMF